ncbi:MAG: transcriptional regulator with XRE-family HTH domain [Thermoproteota archaeon]|jgi:transcriptional regulator with XRE-family HTH domain
MSRATYRKLEDAQALGKSIRAKRKAMSIRIDDAALMIGISKDTLSKIENGSPGVSIGKILSTMQGLGLSLFTEVDE